MFRKIKPEALDNNVFELVGQKWLLVTAGTKDKYNMMTASWGGFGILWNKPVCYIFVRPTRYTYEFMEQESVFSLNVLPENLKEILMICGTKSGRDLNKMEISALTSFSTELGNIGFQESELIIDCKKLYFQDIQPEHFQDQSIHNLYPLKDYHRMYIAEIVEISQKE